jgi:hypothetical protein
MKSMTTFAGIGFLLAFLAVPVQAEVVANDFVDIALTEFVPCANGGAGEVVELTGTLHVLTTLTTTGNNVSAVIHFQQQGVSGVGLTTGDRYRATGVSSDHFTGSLVNNLFTATLAESFQIIGQGPGNNFQYHGIFNLTINANDELTVLHDRISFQCK